MNRLAIKLLASRSRDAAFALPTVLIVSIVMLTVLLASVTAVSSIRTALNDQYYDQIAKEAGEAGAAMATACLRQNNYDPIWLSNPDPTKRVLKPNTLCNGNANASASAYVLDKTSIKTSFTVSEVTTDVSGFVRVKSDGVLQLFRTSSPSTPWRMYQQTAFSQSNYVDKPQIASGAGWKAGGHNGYMLAANGVLYAWGSNNSRQVGDPSLGTSVGDPTRVVPPTGTTKIKRVYDSGQGASILCVLAGDDQIYCRGSGGLGGLTWQRFGLAGGLTALDMDMNGYGADSACVIASDGQVYCAGMNDYGMLGNGQTVNNNIPMTTPTRFLLPAGVTAKKVFNEEWTTCVITNTDDAYCAGVNNLGQTGRGDTSTNVSGMGHSVPARSLLPAGVKVKDIKLTYHGSYVGVYYLGTNGSVYMSGHNGQGTANDGSTTYTTFYATPRQITTAGYKYASIFSVGQDGNHNNSLCMIREDPNPGMTWCIGNNEDGQLGDGTCSDRGNWVVFGLPAGQAATQNMNFESGYQMNSFMVITETGRVFAAGDNKGGKLGNASAPLQECNGTPVELVMPFRAGSATERVKAVALANSDEYTAYVLGDNGVVYSVGLNGTGQLGKGDVDGGVTFSGDTLTSPGTPARSPVSIIMPRVSVSF